MSLLAPIPAAHRTETARSREAKAKIIRLRAEEALSLSTALFEIAGSGDTDANMTEAANIILAVERIEL